MKTKLAFFLTSLGVMSLFSACSDDPKIPGSEIEPTTYTTTAENLLLTVDGEVAAGQSVTFTPASDGTATVTITGENLDISSLIDISAPLPIHMPTSSVIPGSASVTLNVTLAGNPDQATFVGEAETEYCTFKYNGTADKNKMALALTDITLKNTSMAGKYNGAVWNSETANVNDAIRIIWLSDKKIEMFPGWELPAGTVAGLALAMTQVEVGDTKATIGEALTMVLKDVTLGTDGSITATYTDTNDEFKTKVSPKGYARYVVKDDNTILVFIDPAAIIANTLKMAKSNASRALDIEELFNGLMTNVVPMLANGIPVHHGPRVTSIDADGKPEYDEDPNSNAVSFYLGTETMLPILKMAAPVLSDPEIVNAIVEAASKDPSMGSMAGMLPGILKALPEVIDKTSVIEVGINLYK